MTMPPEQFHDLLDRETAMLPPDPMDAGAAITTGRRSLRRRRVATGLGFALVVVLGSGAAIGLDAGVGTHQATTATEPHTDAELVDACYRGNQGPELTKLFFASGAPTVEAAVRTDYQWELALQSADGHYWAECFVHLQSSEFPSGMTIYDASGKSHGVSYGYGFACGLVHGNVDPNCRDWSVETVDRLPAPVAAVRFDFADGSQTTVQTVDGYYVLNRRVSLPEGVHGRDERLTRVTYLNAAGQPLAAEAMDGSGSGPDGRQVGDLAELSEYPSLRSDPLSVGPGGAPRRHPLPPGTSLTVPPASAPGSASPAG